MSDTNRKESDVTRHLMQDSGRCFVGGAAAVSYNNVKMLFLLLNRIYYSKRVSEKD